MTLHQEQIRRICEHINLHIAEPIRLRDLARQAGMSPFHLQRVFKAALGITPRQYAEACRVTALKRNLRRTEDVTEAIYAAGFGSSSRVYERTNSQLGMTPREYQRGGQAEITFACDKTDLGLLIMAATDRGLCFVQFGDSESALKRELEQEYPHAKITQAQEPYHPDFARWMLALNEHIRGTKPDLNLPLDIRATAFRIKVWNYLQQIPYGRTESYRDVAEGIGQPAAVRAVASACAANPVALLIPCHRVIRASGETGEYRSGAKRKKALLEREADSR